MEVEGEGCNFQLNVISDELAALSPVKRQQQIYAHLNPWIADGSIHAVTMKFFSRTDWAARLIGSGPRNQSFQAERLDDRAAPSTVLRACGLRVYPWTN